MAEKDRTLQGDIRERLQPEAGSGFERQVDAEVERMRRAGHAH